MGWFNKDEKVPEIPLAPTLPELPSPEGKKDLPELPSFPASSMNENLNQEIVKSAVSDAPSPEEEEDDEEGIPEVPEVEEKKDLIPPRPSESPIPEPPKKESIMAKPIEEKRTLELNASIANKPITKEHEPIFVRVDKFQSAQKNFDHIKEKIKEMDSTLRKIKDVKSREEAEISGWAEEIEKVKARLNEIDSDIFDQI